MISFSSITDRPKTDLNETADEWYITNSIIKDPHKSFHTRRKIKVGDNNDILDAEDSSVDRVSDSILQFARNVNPMVAVQYNNNNGKEAFLPYRIIRDGAFRPPLDFQYNTIPLSRTPRVTTNYPNFSSYIDYSKNILPSEEAIYHKAVQNTLMVHPLQTNKGFEIEFQPPPFIELFKPTHINLESAKSSNLKMYSNPEHLEGRMQDYNPIAVRSALNQNKGVNFLTTDIPLRENVKVEVKSTKTFSKDTPDNRNLTLPEALQVKLNLNKGIKLEPHINNGQIKLKPTRDSFSFIKKGNAIPTFKS